MNLTWQSSQKSGHERTGFDQHHKTNSINPKKVAINKDIYYEKDMFAQIVLLFTDEM